MAWITLILNALGIVQQDAPIIEKLLAGIGQFVAKIAGQIFGATAEAGLTGLVTDAENLVKQVDADVTIADTWFQAEYPTIEALLAANPWLPSSLYVHHGIRAGTPAAPAGLANKAVEIAHSNVRMAATP